VKNLNKLIVGLFFGVGVLVMAKLSTAASVAIAPKENYVLSQTTAVTLVTPAVSTNAVTNASYMPGAVYEVDLASGAASEFIVMYDSANTTGITCGAGGNVSSQIGARLFYGSTTANTLTRLDPPLVFHNGLVVCDSAVTGQAAITYELGRGLSGQ
jgi:hypothetical protein